MELIKEKDPNHNLYKIKEEYSKLIQNITRTDNYSKFIGGLPITLERKDTFNLFSKTADDNYRYSITQKVDGIRVLLFTSYKERSGGRKIYFVDRENNFYELKNEKNETLPLYNGPQLLIDGELILFLKNNTTTTDISTHFMNIKSFSFMAFDILYGPTRIEYSGKPYKKLFIADTPGAMAGPIGGNMWPYIARYNILYRLIYPPYLNEEKINLDLEIKKELSKKLQRVIILKKTKENIETQKNDLKQLKEQNLLKYTNDYKAILYDEFSNNNWFTIEIKELYFISSLNDDNNPYKYYQNKLIETRKKFYEHLNNIAKIKNYKNKQYIPVKLDGLIFTPFNTNYIIGGSWNEYLNVQYKWKPLEEQSIDFSVEYLNKNIILNVINKNGELVEFNKIIDTKYTVELREKVKDGTIVEFTYSDKKFIFKNLRKEKKRPNGISTALSVLKSIKYPVELNKISKFLILNTVKEKELNKIINNDLQNYLPIHKLGYCLLNNNEKLSLFIDEEKEKQIKENLELYKGKTDYEFEIRLGYYNEHNFVTNLSYYLYKNIVLYLKNKNKKFEENTYYDYIENLPDKSKLRKRDIYIEEFNQNINLETIKKTTKENIDIQFKNIFKLDARFSLSQEKEKVNTEVNSNNKFRKNRITFKLDKINIDCTEITNLNTKKVQYQVELEVVNKKITFDELIKVLLKLLSIIN